MNHGVVDVFAFQEALLIKAAFGIAILVIIWAGSGGGFSTKKD